MPYSLNTSRPILITEIEAFGGAERSLIALSMWLHKRGFANYLLTYIDHCNLAQYATHPLTVVELRPKLGAQNKIASLRRHFQERGRSPIKPLLSGYQPALHATLAGLHGAHCLMHDTPSLLGMYARRTPQRRLRTAVSNFIIGYGLRSGGKTIVTSEYLRSECRREFGVNAEIVRMGGLRTVVPPCLRKVRGTLRMLSVCRIEQNKRIDWILRSLAALEKASVPLSARVDWRLDVAGKGSQIQPLSEMAAALGIGDRVQFHGFLTDDALDRLYDQAHLFLMPAIQGYGIPAIESLQRGLPVLLHRESGVSDILMDTPWATVLEGGESNMRAAMETAINGVIEEKHSGIAQPHLPTEDEWAEQVAALCNWID